MMLEWKDIEKKIDYYFDHPEKTVYYDEDYKFFYFRFRDDPGSSLNEVMRRTFGTNQIEMEKSIKQYRGRWETGIQDRSLNAEFNDYLNALAYLNDVLIPKIMAIKMAGE